MEFLTALYYTSDLGVSTYDAIALVMAEKWKVARFPFCRIGVELVSVILGAVLYYIGNESMQGIGGLIGAGTIITAFCMGPLIQYFKVKIAIPMLNRE